MNQLTQAAVRPQQATQHEAAQPCNIVSDTSRFKGPAPCIITRTQADRTIQLTHAQYQRLARLCKEHAGKPLNIASEEDMGGDFGMVNYWALPVINDATKAREPYYEQAYIHLSYRINTARLRAAGPFRPECDWSKLKNSELFDFVVWHEIGHFRDNFHPMDILFASELSPEAVLAGKKAPYINEVLADRYAWERVRPGQPMPLTEEGRANAKRIEQDIKLLSRFFKRADYPLKIIDTDQYRHVPSYMLTSKRKAAYVGPDVHPELLKREIGYFRKNNELRPPWARAGL